MYGLLMVTFDLQVQKQNDDNRVESNKKKVGNEMNDV